MLARPTANGALCPFCELTRLFRLPASASRPSWALQPVRHVSSQQRMKQPQRKPAARMELSRSVAQPSLRPLNRKRQEVAGPFRGMNRVDAGIRIKAQAQRAETRSSAVTAFKRDRKQRSRGSKERKPGDMKALKMQQSLHHVPYALRNQTKSTLSGVESFVDFDILPTLQRAIQDDALSGLADIAPTPIQRLAVPTLLKALRGRQKDDAMQQFLLAAETGSGKTMAYAIPVINAIKQQEQRLEEKLAQEKAADEQRRKDSIFELESPPLSTDSESNVGRPRAIVLLPSAELVDQVGSIFKTLSHQVKFRTAIISASYSPVVIRNRLFEQPIDVLISTPHLLSSIADTQPSVLSRVTHLIADEADSLFDRSFAPMTSAILDRTTPTLKQLILCSATIPRALDTFLRRRFPDITRLTTPNLHAIPRRVQLATVDIDKEPYRGNRDLACADAIWTIGREKQERAPSVDPDDTSHLTRIIVFVNERAEAARVAEYLVSKGIDAAPLNRDTTVQRQSELLAAFTSAAPPATAVAAGAAPADHAQAARRVLINTKVLVTTDLGSRGIDTVAVRHVLLYDVPHTTIDFIHRLGRTGRMGRRGRGIVFVGKYDRKDIVREVREGMFRGQALI